MAVVSNCSTDETSPTSLRKWSLLHSVYRSILTALIVAVFGFSVSCDWLITERTIIQGDDADVPASRPMKVQESGSTTIRNLGLLAAGIFALGLAIWRSWAAHRQSKATESQSETADRELWNSRFVTGVNMLASEHQSVRMCGVFELQHLLADSPQPNRIQLTETLCAFVRQPVQEGNDVGRSKEETSTVLQGFSLPGDRKQIPVTESNLETDLSAYSYGNLNAPWERSDHVPESSVEYPLKLSGANLDGLSLHNVNLAFSTLRDATVLGTRISWSDLSHAILRGANFSSPHVVEGRRWPRMLHNYNAGQDDVTLLLVANLRHANCIGTTFVGTNFWYSDLSHANLWQADLAKAVLIKTDLSDAVLAEAKLIDAQLEGCKWTGAKLQGADVSGADFGAHGNPAIGLTQAQLDQCIADRDKPPKLDGVLDAETGQSLRWIQQG